MRATDSVLKALTIDPDLPQVRLPLATIYEGTGRAELAEDQIRRVIEEQPSNSDAHRMLAQTLVAQGQFDEGVAEYEQAIALRPNYWRNHGDLGLLYFQIGRRPLAAGQFRRVTELLPERARGFQMLGSVYQALGERQTAREIYERALEYGELPTTHSNIGVLHYAEGNYEESARSFEQAVEASPEDFRWRRNLGDAYRELGRDEDASVQYGRAVELARGLVDVNPTNAILTGQLAVLETLVDHDAEARRRAEEAIAMAPDDPSLHYLKAVVHASADDVESALASLRAALERGFPVALVRQQGELVMLEGVPEFEELLSGQPRQPTDDANAQIDQLRGLLESLDSAATREGRR